MDIHSTYMCYSGPEAFTKALWLSSMMMCRSAGSRHDTAGMQACGCTFYYTLYWKTAQSEESWAVTMQLTGGPTTLEQDQQGVNESTCHTHMQFCLQLLTIGRVQSEQGRQAQR